MKRRAKLLSVLLIVSVIFGAMPLMTAKASAASSSVKTYVFFGSDSRANDDSWRSPSGGKITADKSGTQGTPRSDVIMLLKVDTKKKTIDVMSIYRDTLLDVSGKGKNFQKANKAYADLGPKAAVKALQKDLDIKIDGYVVSTFKGVAEVIDALGGVAINVENEKVAKEYRTETIKTVRDIMNLLIDEQNRVYGTDSSHVKKTGTQTLNGTQAVAYARVRSTEGYDMQRSVRQRKVLQEMSNKYRKASADVKANVLLAVMNNIDTNINPITAESLFKQAAQFKIKSKKGFPYYKKSYTMKTKQEIEGKAVVYVPSDLKTNVTKLHKSFYGQKKYKPSKTVKKYSNAIVKKTKITYKKRTKKLDNKY